VFPRKRPWVSAAAIASVIGVFMSQYLPKRCLLLLRQGSDVWLYR
jgi:hypothetical protein